MGISERRARHRPRQAARVHLTNVCLRIALTACLLTTLGATSVVAQSTLQEVAVEKPRVIVLTDITNEPDDQQSLVRFLVYSNMFDVEGLVATTSTWLRDVVRPDVIEQLVDAYGEVRPNLLMHAEGYPTEAYLRERIRSHLPAYGMDGVGEGRGSEGSRLIIDVVDREDERPVWIAVWGGANCLAQALWDVRETRTKEELDRFVSKLRVYTISDQDDSGRWMRREFPELFYIVSPSNQDWREYYRATWTGIAGDRHYGNGPFHHFELVENPWLEEHVINGHGPLGALYPRLEYIMEGDTPSFLGLIDNGLGSALSPAYGGWGGRYQLYESYAETRPIWTNNMDARDEVVAEDGRTYISSQATIWRWRDAFQHDFAARMDWCVRPYADANHNPSAVVNGHEGTSVLTATVPAGEVVRLSAIDSSDPDGDELTFRWWTYPEAGSYEGDDVVIEGANSPEASFRMPKGAEGETLHVILEVVDDGEPNLRAYRRIIVEGG